jgi:hypothetical protein
LRGASAARELEYLEIAAPQAAHLFDPGSPLRGIGRTA